MIVISIKNNSNTNPENLLRSSENFSDFWEVLWELWGPCFWEPRGKVLRSSKTLKFTWKNNKNTIGAKVLRSRGPSLLRSTGKVLQNRRKFWKVLRTFSGFVFLIFFVLPISSQKIKPNQVCYRNDKNTVTWGTFSVHWSIFGQFWSPKGVPKWCKMDGTLL